MDTTTPANAQDVANSADVAAATVTMWANPYPTRHEPSSYLQRALAAELLFEARLADRDGAHPMVAEQLRTKAYWLVRDTAAGEPEFEQFVVGDAPTRACA